MRSQRLANGKRDAGEVKEITAINKKFTAGLKPGDVLWVKNRQTSWWPAQVADESTVSKSSKPRKRISNTVLVRLYGTYKYLYIDPVKCRADSEDILKQHNWDARNLFQIALERALESISDTEDSEPSGLDSSGLEEGKQLNTKKMKLIDDSSHDLTQEKSCNGSTRRLKVMQGLGLVAPSGSPFHRNGCN